MNRLEVEQLLTQLHAARCGGRLDELCALFAGDAYFKIAGPGDGQSIAVTARGSAEIRAWLAIMLKTFKLTHYQRLATVIDGEQAAVYWRADIHSKITGIVVATELVDLVEITAGRISSFREFFAPC